MIGSQTLKIYKLNTFINPWVLPRNLLYHNWFHPSWSSLHSFVLHLSRITFILHSNTWPIFPRFIKFAYFIINLILNWIDIWIQWILCINSFFGNLILLCKLFSFLQHSINFLLTQSTTIICDNNLIFLSWRLLRCWDRENTIVINIKSNFNLWLSLWHLWNIC